MACPAQLKENLFHFASRGAMDMEGLGRKHLEQMVDKGMIHDPADLYSLTKDDLVKMDRMGDKLAENLLKAIEQSRRPTLARLIYALGIRTVGSHLATVLARHFGSIDKLAGQSKEDLEKVHEIGPIVAECIYNFFHNKKNLDILDKLKKGGVSFPEEGVQIKETPLAGKTFVLTGSLDSLSREEARKRIEERGGRVASSVSKKTDYVVVGKDPGSKYDSALKLGIRTLNEEEFKQLLGS
jgi:DNA ligase (NAD+)